MAEGKINGLLRIMDGSTNLRTLKELNTLATTLNTNVNTLLAGPAVVTGRMTGRKEVVVSTPWVGYKIPLDNIITNRSSVFELSSNAIKVKKSMKALVSLQVTRWGSPNTNIGEFDVSVAMGDTIIANCFGVALDNNLYHYNCAPKLVDISANQIVHIRCGVGGAGTFQFIGDDVATYLTIQEVLE